MDYNNETGNYGRQHAPGDPGPSRRPPRHLSAGNTSSVDDQLHQIHGASTIGSRGRNRAQEHRHNASPFGRPGRRYPSAENEKPEDQSRQPHDGNPGLGARKRNKAADNRIHSRGAKTESANQQSGRYRSHSSQPMPANSGYGNQTTSQYSSYDVEMESQIIKTDSDRNNDRRKNQRKFHVGFKKLEEWSNQEPNIITLELIGRAKGFEDLLESTMSNDTVVLVLKTLAKACLCPFKENKIDIMNLVSKDKFINRLQTYMVVELPFQEGHERRHNNYFWNDVEGFFNNLIIVFRSLIETLPSRACEILPKFIKSIVTITIPLFQNEQKHAISDSVKEKLHELGEHLELCKNEIEKIKKRKVDEYPEDEEEPPDDFREITVYPTTQEITRSEKPFIRRHKIKGAYDNVDHYLDVQFRLLREDFVAPLREGICEYLKKAIKRTVTKASNVRVHSHVEFLCPFYVGEKGGVLVQFEDVKQKPKNKMGYKYCKRFMFGSLVCFTKDNFATILFGRIIGREPKLLENSQIVVSFEAEYDNYELNVPYIMVECNVYFEPYYHVLKALQNMNEYAFPMKNYLIKVETKIESPNYLQLDTMYDIKDYNVVLYDQRTWPTSHQLGFDDTQYAAFKAALTQKFAVIQGPPGTGKTFLGLEIAKTLINNAEIWYNSTPILVICYTNHALDQFLEGLIGTTEHIIRVGGQSKNEKLKRFNLREKRGTVHTSVHITRILRTLTRDLYSELDKINDLSDKLDEINNFETIIRFYYFDLIDPEFELSWFNETSTSQIRDWLFGGRTHKERQYQKRKAKLEQLQEECNGEEDISKQIEMELDAYVNAEVREAQGIDEVEDLPKSRQAKTNSHVSLISVSQLQNFINETEAELRMLQDNTDEQAVFNKKWELERKVLAMEDELDYLLMRLNEGKSTKVTEKPEGTNLNHPHNMSPDDRWKLYFYWLHKYQQHLINKLVSLQNVHRHTRRKFNEVRDIDDTEIMKKMTVVGMTTTCAARLQTVLQALQCRIVIAEEAAEVLESHIIVSLTTDCQHLILIGDHQQLRPTTADYSMEKNFNLGISLFERMVLNKVQCHVLGVQHRMRPEIAKLIVPNIYLKLENHPSVCNFPKVQGINSSLYFIDHNYLELETGDYSKMNLHEATFLIRLANYLIQNGYEPEDITILAAYSGQMFALWTERIKYQLLLQDVRITVLDNYQGEECKIILLSLVRSNKENNIGFLRIQNRVCVALSRAKEGFYIMGNMDVLCQGSEIWPKIKTSLVDQDALGESLLLQCQIHREMTRVRKDDDFNQVPEGGCNKVCGALLKCGHDCAQICHIRDREHEKTKCKAACRRILCDNNHQCKKMCYEICGSCTEPMKRVLPCSHEHMILCFIDLSEYKCETLVAANLPCGHKVDDKPCYIDAKVFRCPFPCQVRVEPCGHACERNCHYNNDPDHIQYKCPKPCSKPRVGCSMPEGNEHQCPKACFEECAPCEIVMKKSRTICPHYYNVPCMIDVDKVECHKPCKKQLPCEHKCEQKCFQPCGNCTEKVTKVHPTCGHAVPTNCSADPDRKNCGKRCPLKLSCGHICKNKCNEPCTVKCKELVDHTKEVACGHKFKISCYLLNENLPSYSNELLKFCTEPCNTELSCEHCCSGTCGACVQGRIHVSCQQKCGVPLICGHECLIPCRETCQPCTQKCSYRCVHSICKKKCGEPCTSCKEPCIRKCPHVQCKKKCSEICTVPPCYEPCPKKLKCGHPCIGFCGDPCPPLCRICDKEEVTEVFLGFEEEKDARFVLLDECKHVFESQGLDGWLKQGEDADQPKEINYKSCPKCKTLLCSTQRYSDHIKKNIRDVIAIKTKFFGNPQENEKKRRELLDNLNGLISKMGSSMIRFTDMKLLIEELVISLEPIRGQKRKPLNKLLGQIYTAQIQILENIIDIYKKAKLSNTSSITKAAHCINFLCRILMKQGSRITDQVIADFQNELKRLVRIMQLYEAENFAVRYPSRLELPQSKQLHEEIVNLLFAPNIYTDQVDTSLKDKLVQLNRSLNSGLGVTDREKQEIVAALGLGKGRWFKCPNGHFYVIGECGGAMQIGICNECGARIGGSNHALLGDNRHTGEIDGSQHPAWPQAMNNMYNFEEFRNHLI